MFNKFLTLLFIFIFSSCLFGQQVENKSNEQITEVNFCDLLKNPNDYTDKIIRVKAIYQSFFEISKMYCSNCLQQRGTWVEFDDDFEDNTKKVYWKKLNNNSVVNVTFVGKFYTGKTFGHQNGYDSQFVVQYMESAEVISKKSINLSEAAKAKTYCQTKD